MKRSSKNRINDAIYSRTVERVTEMWRYEFYAFNLTDLDTDRIMWDNTGKSMFNSISLAALDRLGGIMENPYHENVFF